MIVRRSKDGFATDLRILSASQASVVSSTMEDEWDERHQTSPLRDPGSSGSDMTVQAAENVQYSAER